MSYSPHIFGIVSSGVSQAGKFVLTNSNGDVEFPYGDKVQFGNDVELQVYHDGLHSYITSSSGLKIGTESSVPITIGNSTSEVTVADNLTVTGDFTVNGTTTTINTATVTIDDLVFNIAADASTSAACDGAGINIGDGTDGADASILYDHSGTQWELNKATEVQGNLNVVGTITGDTSLTLDAVTITTAEIGVLDGVTLGTAAASKAMTWDGSSNWTAAGGTCANLGTVSAATSITATDLIGTNVDGIIGAGTARAGTFTTVDATTDFTIDGLVITADTITNDAVLEVVSTGLTLNASLDIALSADGGNVTMDDGTTTVFDFNVDDVELKIHDDAQVANYCSIAVGDHGATTISTVDTDAAIAHLTLDPDGDINLNPVAGGKIVLDGTINVDAGVVTGATSITSTDLIGTNIDGIIGADTARAGTFTTLACTAGALAIASLDIDGATEISEAIVDTDVFIIDNGGGGTNRKCLASRLKTYVGSSSLGTPDTSFTNTEVIGSKVNLFSESSDMTINLPASHSAGDIYYIKNNAASNILTVGTADSDTIDGGGTKILYHQYEAMTVISDGTNWHAF
jgi:hypothetical protein